MVCGGVAIDTCKGDSGGPVIANINYQFTVIGISSYMKTGSCGDTVPGGYADVSYSENLKFIHTVN